MGLQKDIVMVLTYVEISPISQLTKSGKNLINVSPWFHVYQIQSINANGFIIVPSYNLITKSIKNASTTAIVVSPVTNSWWMRARCHLEKRQACKWPTSPTFFVLIFSLNFFYLKWNMLKTCRINIMAIKGKENTSIFQLRWWNNPSEWHSPFEFASFTLHHISRHLTLHDWYFSSVRTKKVWVYDHFGLE